MAIAHFSMKSVSRASGGNAVKTAAYQNGLRLRDSDLDKTYDYRYKQKEEVFHSEIALPDGENEVSLKELWQSAERAEKRKDSKVCRTCDIALPVEFSDEEKIKAMRVMAASLVEDYGVVVSWAIHDKDKHNPHGHMQISTRKYKGGKFTEKTRELDVKTTAAVEMMRMRQTWELINNTIAAQGNHPASAFIDMRTLEAQGIEREAEKHRGPGSLADLEAKAAKAREEMKDEIREARKQALQEKFNRPCLLAEIAAIRDVPNISHHDEEKKAQEPEKGKDKAKGPRLTR